MCQLDAYSFQYYYVGIQSYLLTYFCQWKVNDSDEPFQSQDPNLTVTMYVRIMDDTPLNLVEINICFRSSLWMSWILWSHSCSLTNYVTLSVRREDMKSAYIHNFLSSNSFLSLIKACVYFTSKFSSTHRDLPCTVDLLYQSFYYFILELGKCNVDSFETTHCICGRLRWRT